MKKKLIISIMTAVLTLLPTSAFAAALGDVNGDGFVDYEDYNYIKYCAFEKKDLTGLEGSDINQDGKFDCDDFTAFKNILKPTNIPGDVDGDGYVNLYDKYILKCRLQKGPILPVFNEDGSFKTITLGNSTDYLYDRTNADVNKDGYINYDDLFSMHKTASTVIGDVNSDGVFNKKDVSLLAEYLHDNTVEIESNLADYNNDRVVDDKDCYIIRGILYFNYPRDQY